jgi:hypothetical protein
MQQHEEMNFTKKFIFIFRLHCSHMYKILQGRTVIIIIIIIIIIIKYKGSMLDTAHTLGTVIM